MGCRHDSAGMMLTHKQSTAYLPTDLCMDCCGTHTRQIYTMMCGSADVMPTQQSEIC